MLPSIKQVRLKQLEDNVIRILRLLNDYEIELSDEFDPATKNQYHRRIKDLKQQRDSYERELKAIQEQLIDKQPEEQVLLIKSQLQQIDNKIDLLTDSQAALHQAIWGYFTVEEKALIDPIARQLEETQIVEVKSILEAVESNQFSEEEAKQVVYQLQKALISLEEKGFELPNGNKAIVEILNRPTLDTKHALRVSIPLIPFILTYQGELGLGVGIKLKEVWGRWKTRFFE